MNDIESVEVLKRKLEIAKEAQAINCFFSESKCPVCGNNSIEVEIIAKPSDYNGFAYGRVECKNCGMFSYTHELNSYDAYHWNFDGTSELNMLRTLKYKTERYLK